MRMAEHREVLPKVELDHIVIACADVEQGVEFCQRMFGVSPQFGGRHEFMGTRNLLLGLESDQYKDVYLELICIDPSLPSPSRKRWFGLDSEELQRRLKEKGPELLHFVMRIDSDRNIDILSTVCEDLKVNVGLDVGQVLSASRIRDDGTVLEWHINVREDGDLLLGGAFPTLITWNDMRAHPAISLKSSHHKLYLEDFQCLYLQEKAAGLPTAAQHLDGLSFVIAPMKDQAAAVPFVLEATFITPRGEVLLRSHG